MEDQLMQDHFKEIFDAASSHRTKEEEQPGYLFRRMGLTVEDENPPADAPDFTVDDLPSQPIRPVQNTYRFNPNLHTGVYTKENKYPLASEKPVGFVKKITDASIAGLQDIPAMAQGVRDAGETIAHAAFATHPWVAAYKGYGLLTKDKTALENYAKIEDVLFGAMNKARQERNLTAQEMAAEQAARSGEAANTVLAQAVRSFVPMALTMGAAGAAMKAANIEQAAARMYLTHVGAGYEGLQSGSAIQSEILASGGSGEKALAYGAGAGVAVGATGKLPLEAMLLENKGLWAPILKHMDSLPKVLTTVGGEWMRGFATEAPTEAIQTGIEETTRVAAGVSQASLGDIGSAMGTAARVGGLSGAGTGAVLSTLNFTAETKATVMQQASIAALATVEHHGNPNAKAKMDKAIEKGAQAFTDVGVPADVARKILVTYKDHIVKTQLQGIADVLKTPETVQLSPTAAYMNAENAKAKRVNSIQQRVEMLVDPVAAAQLTPIQDASPDDLARILENTKFVEEKAGKRTAAVAAPTERVQKLLAAKQTSLLKDMKAVQAEYEAADTALKLAAKEDEANSKAKKVAYEPTDAEIDAKLGDEATKKKTETLEAYEARIDKATERAVKELKAEAKKNAKAYAPKADAANAKLEEVSKRMAGLHAQLTRLMTGDVTVVSDGEKADVDIDAKPTREQNKDKELKVLAGKVREAVESTDKKKKGLLKSSFDALTGWLQSQSLPDEVTNHIDAIASKAIAEAGTLTPELVSQFEAAVESARKAQITEMYREEIKAQYERTDKSVAEMRLWYREQAVAEDIRGAYDQILRLPEEQRLEVARQAVDAYRASLGVAQDPRYDATNRAMSQFLTTPYSTESRAWVDNMAAVRYLTDNPNTAGYLTADELSTASNMIQQLNVVGKKNLQRILGGKKADITREVALPFLNAMKAGISSMAQDLKVTDKLDTWSRASNSALRMAKSFTTYGSSGKGLFRFPIEALKDLVPNMPGRDAWFERYLNANSSERFHELLIQEFFGMIGDVYGAKTRDDITKIMDRDGEYDKVNVSTNRVLDNGGKLELTFNRAQLRTVTMYWMQPDVKPLLEDVMGLTDEKIRDAWESISGGISAEDMGYMNKTAKMYEELFNRINDSHIQLTGTSINKVDYYTRLYRRTFTTLTDPTSAADRAADRNAFMPGETAVRVNAAVADITEDESYMRQVLRGTRRDVNKSVSITETMERTGGSQFFDIRPDYQIAYDYAMDVSKFIAFTPLVQNLVAVYETMNNESLQNASKQEGGGTTPKQYEFLRKLSEAFGYTEEQARMQLELVRSVAVSRGMTTDEFLDKNIADIKKGATGDQRGEVSFLADGKALIAAAASADPTTFIHEFAHVARRNVLTPTELDIAAKWAGVEKGIWTQEAEEKWAKAVEKYLMEREAPKGGILTAIFAKIKKFLSDVYAKISKEYFKGITVSPELKTVLDGLFPQNAVQVGGMELATDNLIAATNIAGPNVKKVLDAVKNITRNYIDVLSNGDSVDPLLKSKAGSTFIGVTATMMVSSLGQLFVQSSSVIPGLILADVSRSKGYLAQLPNALKALFAQNDPLMTAIRASEFMKNRFEGKMSRETEIIRQLMHKANDPTLTEKERRAFIEKNAPRVMKLMTLGVRHGDMFASSLVAYSVAKAEMANGMDVGAAMAQGEKVVSDTQQSSDAHKNLGLARSGNFATQALMLFTQTGFIMSNAVQDMNRDYSKGVITATQWAKGVVAIVGLSGMLEVLLRGLDPEDEKLARKSPKWFALRFLASGFANTPFLGPVMNAAGNAVVGSALLYEGEQQEDAETRAIGRAFMRSVPTALGRTGLTLQGLIGYWAQTANRTVVSATESKKAFDMLSGVIDSGDQTDEETMRMAYGYAIDATWQASKMFIPSTPAPAMALPIVNYVSAGLQTLNQMTRSGELSRAGQELLMASIFMGAIKGESVKKLEARHKVAEDANNS